jgi:hypothetical protein
MFKEGREAPSVRGGEMFVVIQAGNVFTIEANKLECHPDRVYLLIGNRVVFAGPSAFTTVIDNHNIISWPEDLHSKTLDVNTQNLEKKDG